MGERTASANEAVDRQGFKLTAAMIATFGQRTAQTGAGIARPGLVLPPAYKWIIRQRLIGSAWLERLYDTFQSYTLTRVPGAGSITEANGVLTLALPGSAQGIWWNGSLHDLPHAYRPFGEHIYAFDTVLKIEGRCYQHNSTDGNSRSFMMLFNPDYQNGYMLGYRPTSGNFVALDAVLNGGTVSNLAYVQSVASPSTSPHTWRLYYNPTSRPLFVVDAGQSFTINAKQLQAWYQIGDSGTSTLLHSRTFDFTLSSPKIGYGIWSSSATYPALTSLFSYLAVYQWDATKQRMLAINKQVSFS